MTVDLAARSRELLLEEFGPLRRQAEAAIALFEEGATLPFIARYRKERTGGLTETQLKDVKDRLDRHTALRDRKAAVLDSLREQNVLTPELERAVVDCREKARLEDLYLPYRPKRRTRAQAAREKGYGPLAELIWAHRPASGTDEAMAGAADILAERMAEDPAV
ncbi:MAG TPA: Tex-like N-terminal domain-containing protein, partial [Planctomycetota bacterium]|nr:Tex-like N-terminal domain-containing protein [Planctomycetota bacterium]